MTPRRQTKTVAQHPREKLSNEEIVTIAVYLAGGDAKAVDTEDVAMKANSLAPGRFTWRKFREQVDLEVVRKRLWDARRPHKNAFLLGSSRCGWTLTKKGLEFARANAQILTDSKIEADRHSLSDKQRLAAERRRLLASEAYQTFRADGSGGITPRQAEAFFRLDDYVVGGLRERKVQRLLNTFSDDPELGAVVRAVAAALQEKPK
jgi:hypothetical protein